MRGPPSPEVTGVICRVPSTSFSQAPRYTLPVHLCRFRVRSKAGALSWTAFAAPAIRSAETTYGVRQLPAGRGMLTPFPSPTARSEEHTSELQSLMRISYAVFCLNKKNKRRYYSQRRENAQHTN